MPAQRQRASRPVPGRLTQAGRPDLEPYLDRAWDEYLAVDPTRAAEVALSARLRPGRRPLADRLALTAVSLVTAGALLAGMSSTAAGEQLAAVTGLTTTTEAPVSSSEPAPQAGPVPVEAPPAPEPAPVVEPTPAPEPAAEAPVVAPTPAPEPAAEPAPVADPDPVSEPAPVADAAPAVEPAPTAPAPAESPLKAAPVPTDPTTAPAPAAGRPPAATPGDARPVHRPTPTGRQAPTGVPVAPRAPRTLDSGRLADLVAARQAARRRAVDPDASGAAPGSGSGVTPVGTPSSPDAPHGHTPAAVQSWGPSAGLSAAAFLGSVPFVAPPAPLPVIELLDPAQAALLHTVARDHGVSWTLLAAIARLESDLGAAPGVFAGRELPEASGDAAASLPVLAAWLAEHGAGPDASRPFAAEAALETYFAGHADPARQAERVAALAAYYYALTAVGAERGLAAAGEPLSAETAGDSDIALYPGGRRDVELGRIDPRVLLVVRYLEASFGSVGVSSLVDGHRVFSSSGNVSAHVYGRAVDVAELGGVNLIGNMGPGSVTERAARLLLLLPGEVAPRQIISLVDLDGPTGATGTFVLADHWDHLHIGF